MAATTMVGVAVTGPASANTTRINGGVEDGTFSPRCVKQGGSGQPSSGVLSDANFRNPLGATVVRVLVPYNVAIHPNSKTYQCLDKYLNLAKADHVKVEVSLNRAWTRGDKRAGKRGHYKTDPSQHEYATDLRAFHGRFGSRVANLTAWNEPNNKAYLKDRHAPQKAATYFVAAAHLFHHKVVAGDFASGVGKGFLHRYAAVLKKNHLHPRTWAIHPYTDVTNFQYYLSKKGRSPRQAGRMATKHSKVLQFARGLARNGYGSNTLIWLNEIYVTSKADKCPPGTHRHGKKHCTNGTKVFSKKGKKFSQRNQAYAGMFIDGMLGDSSLPGSLPRHGRGLPRLSRYIYLRAWTANRQLPRATVLDTGRMGCLWKTLSSHSAAPDPSCTNKKIPA